MRIRTIEKLSESREFTPEGYLLCKGAALARTGVLRYLAEEVDPELMEGSNSKEALLYREEKEVFDPRAMASFEGKPLTLDHPDEDVVPENWQELARGIVLNVRRGAGTENDLLLADILVTDAEAIELIKEGLHELSCGYDTNLEIVKPGIGNQTQIRGNHVALVNKGRAGKRCCIKDTEEKMAKKDNWFAKMRKLLRDAETETTKQDNEAENPQPSNDNDTLAADIQEIKLMLRTLVEGMKQAADNEPTEDDEPEPKTDEGEPSQDNDPNDCDPEHTEDDDLVDNEPEQTEDEEPAKANDSMPLKLCDSKTARIAHSLGLTGAREGDSAIAVHRGALAIAMRDADTARICKDILGNVPLARAGAQSLRAAFMAVSAIKSSKCNQRTADALTTPGKNRQGQMTPAQINKLNKEYYGGK